MPIFFRFPRPAVLTAVFLALATTGCSDGETLCTLDIRHSTRIEVLDVDGEIVTDARLRYAIDGGAEQDATCLQQTADKNGCLKWVAGQEQTGVFRFDAETPDNRSGEANVEVKADECHVITKDVTITVQ